MAITNFKNVPKRLATRTQEQMKPVLWKPNADGPANHYYMIRGGTQLHNMTLWEPGVVGGEYIKTFGHYHVDDLPETYWFLNGEGFALLQKLEGDGSYPARLEEFKIIPVKAGFRLDIPIRYGHLAVNTSDTFMTTADDSPVDFGDADPVGHPGHAEYKRVEQMHGFAYYVIDHNGRPALARNKNYTYVAKEDLAGLEVIE
jgi:glucose-6-phosphate isomerase